MWLFPPKRKSRSKTASAKPVERRVFPGYVLVEMVMDEDSWFVVRNTPGVTGFVGMGDDPTR
jgi:transcriptional antiterminator NusG